MKVLFLNQFFWPDSSATSQQLTDLSEGLVHLGFEVTVVCSQGGYANAASDKPPQGVHIVQVPVSQFARGYAGRILSYLSFYLLALGRTLALPRQDVIVSMTTPPLISLVGALVALLRRSRHVIYEQDMYPDVAVDLGVFKARGIADRLVGALADSPRRRAETVIALGDCMRDRLLRRGVPAERIVIAENWASAEKIIPLPRPGDAAETVLLYSGNLGLAHELETLKQTLLLLREDSRFRFLFVGGGARRTELEQFCHEHDVHAVEFRPYVPRDQLSQGLAAGDIGLVTQENACCGTVVPSKVYGILAAERPILFIGPAAATPALVIRRHDCGWHIAPGDVQGLQALLLHLADHPELVRAAGRRARAALEKHYDLPVGVERVAHILKPALKTFTPTSLQRPTATHVRAVELIR